jgi:hypothetical protein
MVGPDLKIQTLKQDITRWEAIIDEFINATLSSVQEDRITVSVMIKDVPGLTPERFDAYLLQGYKKAGWDDVSLNVGYLTFIKYTHD